MSSLFRAVYDGCLVLVAIVSLFELPMLSMAIPNQISAEVLLVALMYTRAKTLNALLHNGAMLSALALSFSIDFASRLGVGVRIPELFASPDMHGYCNRLTSRLCRLMVRYTFGNGNASQMLFGNRTVTASLVLDVRFDWTWNSELCSQLMH